VASHLAVQTLRAEVRNLNGRDPRECLLEVFQRANRLIFEKSVREPDLTGMGTTLAAAIAAGTRVVVANVGDSRLYLFRDGDLSQVTEDHSWAAEQRRRKLLSEHDIRQSPFRSMITRSLGYAEEVIVDTFAVEAEEDDVLLFCTDGLYGLVPVKRIARILKKSRDPKAACQALIETAKKEGGDDNVTVVIARFSPSRTGRPAFSSDTVRLPAFPEDP
jgi:serine/threonine protein phosphatase PrpC